MPLPVGVALLLGGVTLALLAQPLPVAVTLAVGYGSWLALPLGAVELPRPPYGTFVREQPQDTVDSGVEEREGLLLIVDGSGWPMRAQHDGWARGLPHVEFLTKKLDQMVSERTIKNDTPVGVVAEKPPAGRELGAPGSADQGWQQYGGVARGRAEAKIETIISLLHDTYCMPDLVCRPPFDRIRGTRNHADLLGMLLDPGDLDEDCSSSGLLGVDLSPATHYSVFRDERVAEEAIASPHLPLHQGGVREGAGRDSSRTFTFETNHDVGPRGVGIQEAGTDSLRHGPEEPE